MGKFLTYVLAAIAASAAAALVDAPRSATALSDLAAEGDPRLLAEQIGAGLITVVLSALAIGLVVGALWLLAQLGLRQTIGEATGVWTLALGVGLFVVIGVGGSFAMWRVTGFDPSYFGGMDRVLLWEAVRGIASGLAWGGVFWFRGSSRSAKPTVAAAG